MRTKLLKLWKMVMVAVLFILAIGMLCFAIISMNQNHVETYADVRKLSSANEDQYEHLIAACEDDLIWINGIPYVEIRISMQSYVVNADDVVLASPDFIANSDGYITQYRQNSNGKVSIPATLTDGTIVKGIAGRAFISKSLSEVEIPYTVEEIQSNAFMTCQNLTTIQWTITPSDTEPVLLSIGASAFFRCTSLVDVNFPARLSSLNQAAFKNCTKLENIIIDDGCENYRNGTNGFEGVVYLSSQSNDDIQNCYIWPEAKEIYELKFILEGTDDFFVIQGPANYTFNMPLTIGGKQVECWYKESDFSGEPYSGKYTIPQGENDISVFYFYAKVGEATPADTYTLTFDLQKGGYPSDEENPLEKPLVLKRGEDIQLPGAPPERNGYELLGWYTLPAENGEMILDADGKGDYVETLTTMTLYAAWEAKSYTVKFYDYDGGGILNITVSFGGDFKAELPADKPPREGYEFIGWAENRENYNTLITDATGIFPTDTWKYMETLSFYAMYQPIQYNFLLSCPLCQESQEFPVLYDSVVKINSWCSNNHNGYSIKTWKDKNGNPLTDELENEFVWKFTDDQAFEIVWALNEYTITYMDGDTQIFPDNNPDMYTVEDNIEFQAYEQEGYDFRCWRDTNGDAINGIKEHTKYGNLIIFLDKVGQVYSITLSYLGAESLLNQSLITEIPATYGQVVSLPRDVKLGDYNYATWENENGNAIGYEFVSKLLSDVTYYAHWEAEASLFNPDGVLLRQEMVVYGKEFYFAPYVRTGYTFRGWATAQNGGSLITNSSGDGLNKFNLITNFNIYANDVKQVFTVTLDAGIAGTKSFRISYGDRWPFLDPIIRKGYDNDGFYYLNFSDANRYYTEDGVPVQTYFRFTKNITLKCRWSAIPYGFQLDKINYYQAGPLGSQKATFITAFVLEYEDSYTYTAGETHSYQDSKTGEILEYGFTYWRMCMNGEQGYDPETNPWVTYSTDRTLNFKVSDIIEKNYPNYKPSDGNIYFRAVYNESIPKPCVTPNTLIMLADGTQKAVEELTGHEMLLVWNLETGTFDSAPILFIDNDPEALFSVINLYFSDGTQVEVLSEHGFWDYNLNKYVYLDKDAAQYIGHWFNKISTDDYGNSVSVKVQLVNVVIQDKYTTAWSPITYGHYCYYVNGMLSMPGGIEGMFNIFEVDAETMKYDEAQMQADIAQYGLFTYEEFAELFPIPQEVFEAFNGQYLKVAMGKGLIDAEGLQTLIERYAEFLSAIE